VLSKENSTPAMAAHNIPLTAGESFMA